MTPPPDPSNLASNPPTITTDKANSTKRLPTPRTLLTTLLNAISAIPLAPPPPPPPPPPPSSSSSLPPGAATAVNAATGEPGRRGSRRDENPLRRVPPSHRHLITTLHALFPGLVLPALDLLERGLVAGVVRPHDARREGHGSGDSGGGGDAAAGGPDAGGGGGGGGATGGIEGLPRRARVQGEGEGEGEGTGRSSGAGKGSGKRYAFFIVQSAAAAEARERGRRRKRGGEDGGGEDSRGGLCGSALNSGNASIVRLDAWHCSCAAFAFASVQGDSAGSRGCRGVEGDTGMCHDNEHGAALADDEDHVERGVEGTWSFGGLSLDGTGAGAGEGIPVCKHLLACVLADRWHTALGSYVIEKTMQREEVAGILAEM
ncbi:uncharacterized protein P884DRAFT_315091 [Thermothelomyces heterothallicus CBS 202.75]|uniref:uncharacterized protein n=1 Tax=Thermothelomyces heterothallicus CBS 202.75 TaxID=1149848 RepID=UPI003743C63C